MRVVAGSCRGLPIECPRGLDVRPTTDRVREAVFNALESRGWVAGATVLDLFAGTGALGIEALSRGAAHATFVEPDARTRQVLRRNLDRTGLGSRAAVVADRAERYLARRPPAVGLVLLDPPYATPDGEWASLLAAVRAGSAVIESDRDVPLPAGWREVRRKHYGGTVVLIACRSPDGEADGAPAAVQEPDGDPDLPE